MPCFLTPPISTESSLSQQTELPTPSAETDSNQWQKFKCLSAAAEHLKGDIFEDLQADAQLSLSLVKLLLLLLLTAESSDHKEKSSDGGRV